MEMLAERRFSRFTASAAGLGTIEKLLDAPVESIGDLFRAGYTVGVHPGANRIGKPPSTFGQRTHAAPAR
eukprot:340139-Prymnesium_polylepis.2